MDKAVSGWNESLHTTIFSLSDEIIFTSFLKSSFWLLPSPTNTDGSELSRSFGIGSVPCVSSCKSANETSDNTDIRYQLEQDFSIGEL